MSHEMESTDGAVYAGKPAWHGLGRVVENAPTPGKALQLAGMGWQIIQAPLLAIAGNKHQPHIEVPDHVANIRSDTREVLAVVGDGFRPFQNSELADFIYAVAEKNRDLIEIETAGSLKGGRLVYMLARSKSVIELGDDADDVVKPFIGFFNGHDGSMALQVKPITMRVVCRNTWRVAMNEKGQTISLRHTSGIMDRIPAAREAILRAAKGLEDYADQARLLAGSAVLEGNVAKYFLKVYAAKWGMPPKDPKIDPDKRKLRRFEKVTNEWRQHYQYPRHRQPAGIGGTAWAAYNSISYWADHEKTVRGANGDGRTFSNLFGDAHDLKAGAWSQALETLTA